MSGVRVPPGWPLCRPVRSRFVSQRPILIGKSGDRRLKRSEEIPDDRRGTRGTKRGTSAKFGISTEVCSPMSLTDTACRSALCPVDKARVRLTDSGGLYLEVTPNRSKRWIWKYYFDGKEKRMSLGRRPCRPDSGRSYTSTSSGSSARPMAARRLVSRSVPTECALPTTVTNAVRGCRPPASVVSRISCSRKPAAATTVGA